jgi:hypothetical protein
MRRNERLFSNYLQSYFGIYKVVEHTLDSYLITRIILFIILYISSNPVNLRHVVQEKYHRRQFGRNGYWRLTMVRFRRMGMRILLVMMREMIGRMLNLILVCRRIKVRHIIPRIWSILFIEWRYWRFLVLGGQVYGRSVREWL